MRIGRCPVCGRPGVLVRVYRNIGGRRFGPYPQVEHYAGYDRSRRKQRPLKKCYIRTARLEPNEKVRILQLLRKHS